MSIQKLHPLEKTAIQARHTIKRLEVLIETTRNEEEKNVATRLLEFYKKIRNVIPKKFHDVDLEKE